MPKCHTRGDSDKEAVRHLTRICISVDSHLRDRLGWEISPELGNPYPVDRATVIDFLEKTASKALNLRKLVLPGSLPALALRG